MVKKVCLYFVANPLQYLAAKSIASSIESSEKNILVWYQPGVTPIVREEDWDASIYMPWPRWFPAPGILGRIKRTLENIDMVAALVGSCDKLVIHSAVFDTEAINYFLKALPRLCKAREMHARILPDGIISTRRYPLTRLKVFLQYFRKFRKLVNSRLDYWCFSGDRIGSDAVFCDRIYVLNGFPHQYPPEKVVELPPLAGSNQLQQGEKKALIIGQPLVDTGLLSRHDCDLLTENIHAFLKSTGIEQIDYKGHPKDPNAELYHPDYNIIDADLPLETYMSETFYSMVVGVRSTALLSAKQIYGKQTNVLAFGWSKINFKSATERNDMEHTFTALGVALHW